MKFIKAFKQYRQDKKALKTAWFDGVKLGQDIVDSHYCVGSGNVTTPQDAMLYTREVRTRLKLATTDRNKTPLQRDIAKAKLQGVYDFILSNKR